MDMKININEKGNFETDSGIAFLPYKNNNPIKQFIEESEKAWDAKFGYSYYPASMDGSRWGIDGIYDTDVKSFLSSQHLALLNVVKGVIEGKKVTYKNENDEFFNSDRGIITNQIINEILKDLEIK